VLIHIPARLAVLRRLVQTLRPGGWLLIEDGDAIVSSESCLDAQTEGAQLANRIRRGLLGMLEGRGVDFAFGRSLPRLLRDEGLVDIAGDGFVAFSDTVRVLERANVLQLQDAFIEGGIITDAELKSFLAWLDEPDTLLASPLVMSAWGRRPAA
jgi:hypothetical protein